MHIRSIIPVIILLSQIDIFSITLEDLQSSFNIQSISKTNTQGISPLIPYQEQSDLSISHVDPDRYIIGPGDEFVISNINMPSAYNTGKINLNGDLIIPQLGVIPVGKIKLSKANRIIKDFMEHKLGKSAGINVFLSAIKSAVVTINGPVKLPGSYQLKGYKSIFDAIILANGNDLPNYNLVDLRNIIIENTDTSYTIDLFKYLYGKDKTSNPYLYPGDNIIFEPTIRRLFLDITLNHQISNWIPVKDGETLHDLLSLFTIPPINDLNRIIVKRTRGGSASIQEFQLEETKDIFLQDRDMVTIPVKKNYGKWHRVELVGEFISPGYVPIIKDSTTIEVAMKYSSGLNQKADSSQAILIRFNKKKETSPSNELLHDKGLLFSAFSARPEMASSYIKLLQTNDYTVIHDIINKKDMILKENDILYVPPKEKLIYLSGNVENPGAYKFEVGKNVNYYVRKAGGFSKQANKFKTYIVRNRGVALQINRSKEILPGDVIVVPDIQYNEILLKVIVPLVSTIATTITTLVAVLSIN